MPSIIKNKKCIFATFIRGVESTDDIVCVKITIYVWFGLTVDYIIYVGFTACNIF